jgi:hypothetical protein
MVRQLMFNSTVTRPTPAAWMYKPPCAPPTRLLPTGPAPGHHGLRTPPDLPRPGKVRSLPANAQEPTMPLIDAPLENTRQRRCDVRRGAGRQSQRKFAPYAKTAKCLKSPATDSNPPNPACQTKLPPNIKIRRGAVIRVCKNAQRHLGNHPTTRGRRRLCRAWIHATVPSRRWWAVLTSKKQIQPRDPGLAPTRLQLQAIHLFSGTGERSHTGHRHQRCATVFQRRCDRRATLGTQKLRRHV